MEESAAGRGARTRALVQNPIGRQNTKLPRARSARVSSGAGKRFGLGRIM